MFREIFGSRMGQQGSKPTTQPFENYQVYTGQAGAGNQGPALPPAGMYVNNDFGAQSQIGYSGPVRPTRQDYVRAQRGGQAPPRRGYGDGMDMGFFEEDDNMSGLPEIGRRPQYDPMQIDPRFYQQGGGGGGMAREMIDDVRQQTRQRINPARAQNYRSRPPPQIQPQVQPRITRYRTVVDEPQGYMPPTQAGQGYYAQQQVAQPQQNNVQPQQVTLYYDPQTGAIQNPNQGATAQYQVQQAPAQQQQPFYMGYQQQAQPAQQVAYQQAAPGYQPQAQTYMMPQGYMMPNYQQQQPIVIPAQILSGK